MGKMLFSQVNKDGNARGYATLDIYLCLDGGISLVPRNSKDILAKHLVGAFSNDALEILGLPGIKVVQAMPTELDPVEIRQGFADVVFELDNGTIFHMEFQSTRESGLYRFLWYDVQLAMKFEKKIRTIVLYIGDIRNAPDSHDIGTAQYRVENVYLNQLDGDAALDTVLRHLETGEWAEQDRIRLAFALHMKFGRRTKEEAFEQMLDITNCIPDKYEQNYVTALILGLAGQSITKEQRNHLLEVLKMTDVLREFEQETLEKGRKEGLQQGLQQGQHAKAVEIAKELLSTGDSVQKVAKVTGLLESDVEEIKQQLN